MQHRSALSCELSIPRYASNDNVFWGGEVAGDGRKEKTKRNAETLS